jgi:hypothetical protein
VRHCGFAEPTVAARCWGSATTIGLLPTGSPTFQACSGFAARSCSNHSDESETHASGPSPPAMAAATVAGAAACTE